MEMLKDELRVTAYEARALAARLRGQAPVGFIPGDPDEPEVDPENPPPDLYMCAASYMEHGGKISVKERKKAPVLGKEPPVETDHNPPTTLEPQAGNPMEPGRRKVLAEHPDEGLKADESGDRPAKEERDAVQERKAESIHERKQGDEGPIEGRGRVQRRVEGAEATQESKEEKGRIGTPPTHPPAKVTDVDDPEELVRQQRARKK